MQPTTREAFTLLASQDRVRIAGYYEATAVLTIPENREKMIACSRKTLRGWLQKGLVARVASPDRPPCNKMYALTREGRAALCAAIMRGAEGRLVARSMAHKCSNGASNTTDNGQQRPDPA